MFGLISKFVFRVIANLIGLLVVSYLVAGVVLGGSWLEWLEVATVLALLNILLKPILKLIFGPIIFLTLGLFVLVV